MSVLDSVSYAIDRVACEVFATFCFSFALIQVTHCLEFFFLVRQKFNTRLLCFVRVKYGLVWLIFTIYGIDGLIKYFSLIFLVPVRLRRTPRYNDYNRTL